MIFKKRKVDYFLLRFKIFYCCVFSTFSCEYFLFLQCEDYFQPAKKYNPLKCLK